MKSQLPLRKEAADEPTELRARLVALRRKQPRPFRTERAVRRHAGDGCRHDYPDPELDPAQVTQGIVAGEFVANIFSSPGAVRRKPRPGFRLAEDWEVSEDGTEYTFNLLRRPDPSQWRHLTAEDFIYTYERTIKRGFRVTSREQAPNMADIVAG